MATTFLKALEHLDLHYAQGVNDNIGHLRMVGCDGELETLCGTTFFDWLRIEESPVHPCEECLSEMANLLLDMKPSPPKYQRIDWFKERNILRAKIHECRN